MIDLLKNDLTEMMVKGNIIFKDNFAKGYLISLSPFSQTLRQFRFLANSVNK